MAIHQAKFYASQDHFDQEQVEIFRRNWVCAGFVHQVPNPGDIAPVSVGGIPLMLVRDRDPGASLRVYHNVCRHRGTRLVDTPCSGRQMIRCPYHSWVYGLDGSLRQKPHFDGPDRHAADGEGLWPVRSAIWLDLVFVDIEGSAGDFAAFIEPLAELGAEYGVQDARFDESVEIEIAANWKLVVENFVDAYHVSSVHPALERSVPTRTHRFHADRNICVGQAPLNTADERYQDGSYVRGLPGFPGAQPSARERLTYLNLFPNLCVNLMPDRLSIYHVQPLAPDRSLETIHNYYAEDAFSADREALRRSMTRNQIAFNAEDIDALERLQVGRSSAIYDGGCPSPYWDTNAETFLRRCFEAWDQIQEPEC